MSTNAYTGRTPRKGTIKDTNLVLRAADAAAITQTNGSFASPGYTSAGIELTEERLCRLVIHDLAMTLDAANDTFAHISVIGLNSAGTTQVELAAVRVGCTEVSLDTDDIAAAPLELYFSNGARGVVWPTVKLVVVTGSTASPALTFGAFLTIID